MAAALIKLTSRVPVASKPQREVPLRVLRGTGPVIDATFLADDGAGASMPFDLTGATVTFVRKARAADTDPAAIYSTANGAITLTDPAAGRARIAFASADTPYAGQFRYSVAATPPAGQPIVLASGPLTIADR